MPLRVALLLRLCVEGKLEILRGARPGQPDGVDLELDRLRGEQFDVAATRAERHHPEPVRVTAHDVEGLGADRTGGAEEYEVARGHRFIVR